MKPMALYNEMHVKHHAFGHLKTWHALLCFALLKG